MAEESIAVRVFVGALLVLENAQCQFDSVKELNQKVDHILTEAKVSEADAKHLRKAIRDTDEFDGMRDRAMEMEAAND